MALINCPECNKEISDTSKACLNCGYKLTPKKTINLKLIVPLVTFLVVVAVGISLFASGIFNGDKTSKLSEKEKYSLDCVLELKDRLKNPESFQVHSIKYFKHDDKYDVCVLDYSAQNGFGGLNRDDYICINEKDRDYSKRYQRSELDAMDSIIDKVPALVYVILQDYYVKNAGENIDTNIILEFIK